jgi:lipopolysaccharide export system protein LptA
VGLFFHRASVLPHPARLRPWQVVLPALILSLAAGLMVAGRAAPQGSAPPAKTAPEPATPPAAAGSGMVTIESDSQQADNVTGIVTASGNVRITYPEKGMVATSRQAQYFSKEGKLVLSGDVDVIDADGQRIRAEKLTYRLDSERIVAEPQSGRQVTSRLKLRPLNSQPPAPLVP